jgi:uncharacterized membrane protein
VKLLRHALALMMIGAGAMHFIMPKFYLGMMPSWLPAHELLVALSGVLEILGGLGLLAPSARIRMLAGFGLVALFVAVFPANVNMAVNNLGYFDQPPNPVANWLRLPFQAVFIAWAWVVASRARREAIDEAKRIEMTPARGRD